MAKLPVKGGVDRPLRLRAKNIAASTRGIFRCRAIWSAVVRGGKAISNAIGYALHRSRSHDPWVRVYDEASNVIENARARRRVQRVVMACVRRSCRSSRAASYNLCPVRPVWATTGDQGCHSYSSVAHRLRNTCPEKAGSFLSVVLRQTIIGHGNRCQLHPKLASLCRFRATLNRYRSG
jgi:hypothetical protein